jgi:hypothetical protein
LNNAVRQLSSSSRRSSIASALLAGLFVCSGCASSGESTPYVAPLSVRPIARHVRPVTPHRDFNTQASRDAYVDAFNAGSPIFDAYRRKPGYGKDISDVDCKDAERISVSFFLDKSRLSASARKSTITLQIVWHTPSTEPGESTIEYYLGPGLGSPLAHGVYENIYNAGLLFSRRDPQNGIYTVVVAYRGNELYRDSFNLIGCSN